MITNVNIKNFKSISDLSADINGSVIEDARNLYDKQAHELTEKDCKNCAYSGVGIYCVRNSWTEPFKDGGCKYFSKK